MLFYVKFPGKVSKEKFATKAWCVCVSVCVCVCMSICVCVYLCMYAFLRQQNGGVKKKRPPLQGFMTKIAIAAGGGGSQVPGQWGMSAFRI